MNSILREGLRLGSPPVINEKKRGTLYFLRPNSPTKLWMQIMCELWVRCRTKPILLQINNSNHFYPIRRVFREKGFFVSNLESTDELHTHSNIPAKDIKVVKDLPWLLGNIDNPDHSYCQYLNDISKIDGKWVMESGQAPWLVDGSNQFPPSSLPLTNYDEKQGQIQLTNNEDLEYKSQFSGLEDQMMADDDDFYPSRDDESDSGSDWFASSLRDDETLLDEYEDEDAMTF